MNCGWEPSDLAAQARARAFAKDTLGADLQRRDRRGADCAGDWRGDWQSLADFGALGLHMPDCYGGRGLSLVSAIGILEAIGQGCADNGLTTALNGQIWSVQQPILDFGSDAQKEEYLPQLINGQMLGAHALTEPETGSNAMDLKTTAVPQDGGYVLNGHKTFIGMAPECDIALIFANTKPQHKKWGVSTFLVKATDAGVTRSKPKQKMGLRTVPIGDLIVKDCWIPAHRRLGAEGNGVSVFQHTMQWERSFIFSCHVGAMARQLEECVTYANTREVFGGPIAKHQSVSARLAEMKLRLEAARMFLYRTAWSHENGTGSVMDAAMAKLFISEAFAASSLDAIRIHGGRGYMADGGVEHHLRDAVGGVLYSGTSDIQRDVIAKLLSET